LPRAGRPPPHSTAAPSIADWKNVHSGKALRSEACISLIRAHADLDSNLRVLDVGSERGSFAQTILAAASEALLTCIEPGDDISLPDASFDIVHSARALEQRVSPTSTLADYWRALKPDGLLIIDAPNIALIGSDDIVGEWFIDNHLYHFSRRTLARILEVAGFEIVAGPDSRDHENLLIAARKRKQTAGSVARDYAEVDAALARITSYVNARARVQHAA
jgi:2-polyprenyl-3-methyl-5-hydroxy-6-metoxy-1,4-benzoquinol methylase